MVHQSVLIGGIISIQFELPSVLRKELINNDQFMEKLAQLIYHLYTQCIVPKYNDISIFNLDNVATCVNGDITELINGGCTHLCPIGTQLNKISSLISNSTSLMVDAKKLNQICDIDDSDVSTEQLKQLIDKIDNLPKAQISQCKGIYYGKYLKRRKYKL